MSKFSSLALPVDQPARMTILHPRTGQPLCDADGNPAWIDLLSLDSREAREIDRDAANKRLEQKIRNTLRIEEIEQVDVRKLAAVTKGWHLVGLDGTALDVPCNTANAAELYAENSMLWLRDQVANFVATRANFVPGSSTN